MGVRAVIAESFGRIHRSNLVSMGVLPLTFPERVTRRTLALNGTERFTLLGVAAGPQPRGTLQAVINRADGTHIELALGCRLDGDNDLRVWEAGGILPYVVGTMAGTPPVSGAGYVMAS